MKKTILTLALASLVGVVSAQKPAAGAMGFTGGLTNLVGSPTSGPSATGTLQFKYYVSDGLAARVGFKLTTGSGNGTTVSDSTGNGVGLSKITTTVKSGNTGWGLSLGAQKSLGGTDKLDVYGGADLFFGGATGLVTDKKTETVQVPSGSTTDKVNDFTQSVTTNAGSMNFGLNGFVGFQYFLVEKLAVGAEFAYGYMYNDNTGTAETVNTATVNGVAATKAPGMSTVKSNPDAGTSGGNFGLRGSSLTLSFFF